MAVPHQCPLHEEMVVAVFRALGVRLENGHKHKFSVVTNFSLSHEPLHATSVICRLLAPLFPRSADLDLQKGGSAAGIVFVNVQDVQNAQHIFTDCVLRFAFLLFWAPLCLVVGAKNVFSWRTVQEQ